MPPIVNVDDRLRELHFGPFEGLTQHEIRAQGLSEEFRVWRSETSQRSPAEAETFVSAVERAKSLMSDVVALASPVVLLVSHGHFSRIFLAHCVLGTSAEYHRRMRFDNGHLADIVVEKGKPRLVAFNTLQLEPFNG
jgi:broad specificity phosphatase PhoE